jgi:hypothetical protein
LVNLAESAPVFNSLKLRDGFCSLTRQQDQLS